MLGLRSLAGGIALLAFAGCGTALGSQPAPALRYAEAAFERSQPDTGAGAALQGRLGDPRLTGLDREIEREAFELLARDGEALVDGYIARYGNSVNTDDARELFAAYCADRSRAAAVHRPSTELSERVYAELLAANRGRAGEVVFLAGGAGSGKTTALKRMALDQPGRRVITFDGTFANPAANMARIKEALDRGYEVGVVYVHAEDPLRALGNALDRAERMAAELGSGRTIAATELVEQHARARVAFVAAAEELRSDPRVSFRVIENSGAPDEIEPRGSGAEAVAFIRQRLYDQAEVERLKLEARRIVEERFRAGEISPQTYRGFSPAKSPRRVRRPRRGRAAPGVVLPRPAATSRPAAPAPA